MRDLPYVRLWDERHPTIVNIILGPPYSWDHAANRKPHGYARTIGESIYELHDNAGLGVRIAAVSSAD